MIVLEYDSVVQRSNPKGLLVRFEVESPTPVTRIEVGLTDDQPPLVASFNVGAGEQDGRYFRGIAFKPVVNGVWTLFLKAYVGSSMVAQTTCPAVQVTP